MKSFNEMCNENMKKIKLKSIFERIETHAQYIKDLAWGKLNNIKKPLQSVITELSVCNDVIKDCINKLIFLKLGGKYNV